MSLIRWLFWACVICTAALIYVAAIVVHSLGYWGCIYVAVALFLFWFLWDQAKKEKIRRESKEKK